METVQLIDIHLSSNGQCEACGHDIKEVNVLRFGNGSTLNVGNECVKQFSVVADRDAARARKRMAKAKAQWAKKSPVPRNGEGREEYITRRLGEMRNARRAYLALCAAMVTKSNGGYGYKILPGDQAQREGFVSELESQLSANRVDFYGGHGYPLKPYQVP